MKAQLLKGAKTILTMDGPDLHDADLRFENGVLRLDEQSIRMSGHSAPEDLPWGDVDVALECSGHFTAPDEAARHLEGARPDRVDGRLGHFQSHQIRYVAERVGRHLGDARCRAKQHRD